MSEHNNTLIIGTSGTGKTFLVNKLKAAGMENVYDADDILGIGEWRHHKTQKVVEFRKGATKDWFDAHGFYWNERNLQEWLKTHRDAIVVGIADNFPDFIPSFKNSYFLDIDDKTILKFFSQKENHPEGLSAWQADVLIKNHHQNKQQAIECGCTPISPEEVFTNLTQVK